MNKKYISIVLGIVLIASFVANFFLGSMYTLSKKNEAKITSSLKDMEDEYNELESLANDKINEVCDLYYEKKLRELLPDEDIEYLSFMAWEYEIKINGKDITSPTFYTRSDNVEISFIERRKSDVLPKRILSEGKISSAEGEFEELVKTEFGEEADIKVSDEEGSRMISYYYSNVEAGDVITIRLNPVIIERMMLYERINLKDDKIEVIKDR